MTMASPNATFVEFFPNDKVLDFRNLIDRQIVCENGAMTLPTASGPGFDFLSEAVERFTIDS